jgi:hypothetical protein
MPSLTGEPGYLFACARAAESGLAGRRGSGVSVAEAAIEADAAMALLHKAVVRATAASTPTAPPTPWTRSATAATSSS